MFSNSILHINLKDKESVIKSYPDLLPFLGGVGISSKLILDNVSADPVVLSVGPLNGYFPFASKACAAFLENGEFIDTYVGGRLSTRLRFCGLDGVILEGESDEPINLLISEKGVSFISLDTGEDTLGMPGKRSLLTVSEEKVCEGGYFNFGSPALAGRFKKMNVAGVVVSSSSSREVQNQIRYDKLYYEVLGKVKNILIEASDKPSCSGCPMGCEKSSEGETGGNVFIHSLVACVYAESVYSDIPTVFACLNSLGYDYAHEDLERLPELIYRNIKDIYGKIGSSKLEAE